MTFYEAALRILESEGRPLHFLEITEKSIQQSLLSHIGKTPEVTMLSRLAAVALAPQGATAAVSTAITPSEISSPAPAPTMPTLVFICSTPRVMISRRAV